LVELLDIHLPHVEAALSTASEIICKSARLTNVSDILSMVLRLNILLRFRKCWSLYTESSEMTGTIPTGLHWLNHALKGGLPPGSLTEVCDIACGQVPMEHHIVYLCLCS
jgi:hypothetical protein